MNPMKFARKLYVATVTALKVMVANSDQTAEVTPIHTNNKWAGFTKRMPTPGKRIKYANR